MKSLIAFILLFPAMLLSQQFDKFIIGADWLNSCKGSMCYYNIEPMSDSYWQLIQTLGLNFGTLNFNEALTNGVNRINAILDKATQYNIDIELQTYKIIGDVGKPRRWMYQIEGGFDFSTSIVGDDNRNESAELHWSLININNQGANIKKLLTDSDNEGYVVQDLKSDSEIPDGTNYYLKVRFRKTENVGGTTPIFSIRLINKLNPSIYKEETFFAGDIAVNTWEEKLAFSFYKYWNGPGNYNPNQDNIINIDTLGRAGLPDYELAPYYPTPYEIKIYWYDQVDCELDYVVIEDEKSNNLHNHVFDYSITTSINNFKNHAAVSTIKIMDEPFTENYLPFRYEKRTIESVLGQSLLRKAPFPYHFPGNIPQQFLAQSETNVLRHDNYPIGQYKPVPGAGNYTASIQDTFNYFTGYLNNQIIGAQRFEVPFIFTPQAHSWVNSLREPSAYEIKAMTNLGICYGAKGIQYFIFSTPHISEDSCGLGLLNNIDHQNPIPRSYDSYGYPKWETIRLLNNYMEDIGDELISLTWSKTLSINKQPDLQNELISNVESYDPELMITDGASNTFVEVGFFKKTEELNNSNLDYFYIVNKRTLPTEDRGIVVTINKQSSGFNNWKITEVSTGNSQVISKTGFFELNYEAGEGKLFRLEPVMITGGTLAYNETVPQNTSIQVRGSLIVPSGKSLTVGSGASLTFQNESKLHIYGDLEVNGTSSGKVTFDFVQNSQTNAIKLYSGSSAIIDHAIIKNAEYGINVNQGSLLIQNSEIKDCDVGIYMYGNSYINDETEISYCNIHDNNFWGIELNYSTPLIRNNYISGGSKGVVCLNNSSAFLGKGGTEGFNNIFDVECGIYSYSSDPFLGYYDEKHQAEAGGYNSIVGENYNAHVEMDSYVSANLNWWGTSDPQGETFLQEDGGVIDYDYYLDYSPFGESQTPEEGGEEILVKGKTGQIPLEGLTTRDKYLTALKHFINRNKRDARIYCNSILDEEGENRLKYSALRLLVRCIDEDSVRSNIISKINSTLLTTSQTDYNAYLEMTLADILKSNYITGLDEIITKYRSTKYKPLLLFKKVTHLYFEENNIDSARVICNIMNELYSEHELTKSAKQLFGESTLKKESVETSIIPKEYKLYQNYPNPFNPVTTIKYQLPANSKVTLTIYDILGKEVTKLVDKEQEAGKYQITFDAKRYASGVYICRIIAGDFVKTLKMSLVK